MTEEQVKLVGLLKEAVTRVYAEDRFLFDYSEGTRKGLEQAFVFRTGIYLNGLLQGTQYACLDLDSEYNKNHGGPKSTLNFPHGTRPDLIIHKRDSNEENKLIAEFKGRWDNDINKEIK